MIPTIDQMMTCYRKVALCERMKTGRPGVKTVENVLNGTESVCRAAGLALSAKITEISRAKLDAALARFTSQGLTRLSAWSYICQLRGLTARWCRSYYAASGWTIPAIEWPFFRVTAPRYRRPSVEMLARIKAWYAALDGEIWFAATMMLEFAMRNGDVLRLTEENFILRPSTPPKGMAGGASRRSDTGPLSRFLSYVPHKTELSSGRRVLWPVHPDIWARIEKLGGLAKLEVTASAFAKINQSLRALGFTGTKGAYELRKICIDHIYQRYGAEMAVSISGDDIRTISRYYADPAQPNAGAIRVIDLF